MAVLVILLLKNGFFFAIIGLHLKCLALFRGVSVCCLKALDGFSCVKEIRIKIFQGGFYNE